MKNSLYLLIILFVLGSFVSAAEYDNILAEIRKIADENSQFVQMMDIGKNDQGNFIHGLRFENPSVFVKEGKAAHLLVGTHHGNERLSAYLCTKAAQKLVNIFKNANHKHHKAMSSMVIYVVPVLNIGGFNANRRSERDRSGRYHDPNRDYPDPCQPNSYFKLASTQNLADFVERFNIVGALTVHGYIGTLTFPWGTYTNKTQTFDHDFYSYVAKSCASVNNYRTGTHADAIYPTAGAFEDWCYHKHGTWTLLLELAHSPNLDRDADATLQFFTMLPSDKSTKNQHAGKCFATSAKKVDKGRP